MDAGIGSRGEDRYTAQLIRSGALHLPLTIAHAYHVEHYQHFHPLRDGRLERCRTPHAHCARERAHLAQLVAVSDSPNLVVTAGRDKYLDATLKTGLTTPAWYVGLKGTGTVAAGDTMASHAGWAELTPYSNATRPTWTPGTISTGSVSNSASVAAFSINATSTIYGSFLADNNTKGGATGTLLGAGDYAASRAVESGDTLNVTVTASIT